MRRGKYPEGIRREAVRLVRTYRDEYDSVCAAITPVAGKFGVVPQTVRIWIRRADVDDGIVNDLSSDERQRIKDLQRENRELRRANEILKAASGFAAALGSQGVARRKQGGSRNEPEPPPASEKRKLDG